MSVEDEFADSIARLVYKILQHPGAPTARVMHAIFLNDNATDSNLCDIEMMDGSHITGVPRLGSTTYTSGDTVVVMTGPAMPFMVVEKLSGDVRAQLRINLDEDGLLGSGSPSAPAAEGVLVTKKYNISAFGSYYGSTLVCNQNGTGSWTGDKFLYQGTAASNPGSYYRTIMYLPYSTIASDYSSYDVVTAQSCTLNFRFEEWYDGSGSARFGTHSSTASSAPSTFPSSGYSPQYGRVTSTSWHDHSTRAVSLGATIAGELISGTSKGLLLGPGTSTAASTWYGYGLWDQYKPYITITALCANNTV